jgi:hypothetical protein
MGVNSDGLRLFLRQDWRRPVISKVVFFNSVVIVSLLYFPGSLRYFFWGS